MTQAQTLLAALAATAFAMLAAGLALEARSARRRRFERRLGAYCGGEARLAGSPRGFAEGAAALARPLFDTLTAGLFARARDREEMRLLLLGAGFRGETALQALAACKTAGALLGCALGWWAAFRMELFGEGAALRLAMTLGAGVLGAIAPELVLRRMRSARAAAIRAALPDAIDLLVIAAYAGQSLDMALDRVSREIAAFAPALGQELAATCAEMKVAPDRATALLNFEARNPTPESAALVLSLTQTLRLGSPFAASLKALSADLREARILRAEEAGAKLPALMALPLILFIMPAVFVVVVGPAVLAIGDLLAN